MTSVSAMPARLANGQPVIDATNLFIRENGGSQVEHANSTFRHGLGTLGTADGLFLNYKIL